MGAPELSRKNNSHWYIHWVKWYKDNAMYLVLKVSIVWPFWTLGSMHLFFLDCRQPNEGWFIKITSKCSWTAYLWEATNSSSSLELQTMIHSSSLFVTSTREIITWHSTVMHVSSLKICQPSKHHQPCSCKSWLSNRLQVGLCIITLFPEIIRV